MEKSLLQVKGVSLHPRLPWTAAWDGAETCTVWDYERSSLVFSFNSTRLGRRFGFGTLGNVTSACFCDNDVLLHARDIFPGEDGYHYTEQAPDGIELSKYLHSRRICMVGCEVGIVVHDIPTRSTVLIPRLQSTKKNPPSQMMITFPDFRDARGVLPYIFLGTEKGSVEIYDTASRELVGVLNSASKSRVTSLLASNIAGTEVLVGSSDGSLVAWEIRSKGQIGEERVRLPQAHKGCILELHLVPHEKLILSLGADKVVGLWNSSTMVRLSSFQIPLKDPVLSITPGMKLNGRADFLVPSANLLSWMRLEVRTGEFSRFVEFPQSLQRLSGKHSRVFAVASCPGDRQKVVLGTSAGFEAVLFRTADLTFLPASSLIPAPSVDPIAVIARDGCLSCLQYSLKLQEDGSKAVIMREQEAAPIPSHLVNEVPVICVSGDSMYISVLWKLRQEYRVYRVSASGLWTEVDRGKALSVAWHMWKPTYAVLAPKSVLDVPDPGNEEAEVYQTPDPEDDLSSETMLRVYTLHSEGRKVFQDKERAFSEFFAESLSSGPLLCVCFSRQSDELDTKFLGFHSWETLEFINEVENPRWIAWSGHDFMALGYLDCVAIFRQRPQFQCKIVVDVSNCTAGLWQRNALTLVTPREIKAVFVGMLEGGETDYVEIVPIASSGASHVLSADTNAKTCPLPHVKFRPFGPLRILGIKNTDLWVMDTQFRAHAFDLSHAGTHARILASQGDIYSVKPVLARLYYEYHDQVANYLVALNIEGAVSLVSGTSLLARFYQCLDHEDYHSALTFIEDMLLPKEFEKESVPDLALVLPASANRKKQTGGNINEMFDLAPEAPEEEPRRQLMLKREFLGGVTRTQRFCQMWVEPLQDLKDLAVRAQNRNALQRILQIFQMAGNQVPENAHPTAIAQKNIRNIPSVYRRLRSSGVLAAAMSGNLEVIQRSLARESNYACAGLLSYTHNQEDVSYLMNAWNNKLWPITVEPRQV